MGPSSPKKESHPFGTREAYRRASRLERKRIGAEGAASECGSIVQRRRSVSARDIIIQHRLTVTVQGRALTKRSRANEPLVSLFNAHEGCSNRTQVQKQQLRGLDRYVYAVGIRNTTWGPIHDGAS